MLCIQNRENILQLKNCSLQFRYVRRENITIPVLYVCASVRPQVGVLVAVKTTMSCGSTPWSEFCVAKVLLQWKK
jgi:hypothetical protein